MAGGLAEATIEEIKARTNLAELISSYGIAVRHAGSSLKACCPFHNEKTPSFHINETKGFYHCFGCGESGDAIKFVQKMDGSTFMEAARKLAEQAGIRIETQEDPDAGLRKRLYALMAELAAFYHRCLMQIREAKPARDYLAARDLAPEVQDDYLIGYAPAGITILRTWAEKHGFTLSELEKAGVIKLSDDPADKGYHRFSGRLMFSIKDKQGRVVAFSGRQLIEKKNAGKYVNSPETLIFKKSHVLFGFDRAAGAIAKSPHHEVICCEGQIDTIRLQICGFPNAVASQGTAFTEEHAKMIHRVADSAVLMYDHDAAGQKATIKVARLLLALEMPVRVVSLPTGHDPDSFLREKGAAALQKLIDQAESIVSFQCRVARAQEANPESIDAVSRVSKAVLTTIAVCPSAVLKANLVGEAARLLAIPVAALTEELAKVKPEKVLSPAVDASPEAPPTEQDDDAPILGETPEQATPPPAVERDFLSFLLAQESNAHDVEELLTEFVPASLFLHDFTRNFVAAWRAGDEALGAFYQSLTPFAQRWFDEIYLGKDKPQASGQSPREQLKEFIGVLWKAYLTRRRGTLSVQDGMERALIATDIKRIQQNWTTAKERIRHWMKGMK